MLYINVLICGTLTRQFIELTGCKNTLRAVKIYWIKRPPAASIFINWLLGLIMHAAGCWLGLRSGLHFCACPSEMSCIRKLAMVAAARIPTPTPASASAAFLTPEHFLAQKSRQQTESGLRYGTDNRCCIRAGVHVCHVTYTLFLFLYAGAFPHTRTDTHSRSRNEFWCISWANARARKQEIYVQS